MGQLQNLNPFQEIIPGPGEPEGKLYNQSNLKEGIEVTLAFGGWVLKGTLADKTKLPTDNKRQLPQGRHGSRVLK